MKKERIAEILAQIQVGDELHSMAVVLTPQGIEDGGRETGLVSGKTGLSPLVASKSHPETTIVVPPYRIVAAFRGRDPICLDVSLEENRLHSEDVRQEGYRDGRKV